MSIINNRLQLLRPYLTEIKFGESITLLTGEFYPKWIIKEQGDRVKIHKSGDTDKGRVMYNFYGENGNVNVDDLIDYFLEVVNENLDRERKEDLYKKKVEELKNIFKDSTLTDLERLSMGINEGELKINDGE
tara:strand:- start:16775 stop:17170 length:396 start_codon:yes stop_codon:yes gene_type:complete